MQLELHMDVIDDFVGEAREVITRPAFASAPLLAPASASYPVPALSATRRCSSLRTPP